MPIQIPADITVVTLRSGSTTHPQRFTLEYAQSILQQASDLIQARADIVFRLGNSEEATVEMPEGMRGDVVDTSGFHFLVASFRAGNGVKVICVDRIAQQEIGGRSREEKRVCILPYNQDAGSTARKLAHELGHLLGLGHIDEGWQPGPGREAERAAMIRNLMFSGALTPDALLTETQISQARSSALASRFAAA